MTVSPSDLMNLLTGVVASLFAALIAWSIAVVRERQALRSIEGLWLEVIEGQSERPYSLGEFSFSFWTKRYRYCGTNYTIEGRHYYHWRSLKTYFDKDREKFFYIYQVNENDQYQIDNHGFGLVNLRHSPQNHKLSADSGYFVNAEKQGAAPRQIKFFRANEVAKQIDFNLTEDDEESKKRFVAALVEKKWRRQ